MGARGWQRDQVYVVDLRLMKGYRNPNTGVCHTIVLPTKTISQILAVEDTKARPHPGVKSVHSHIHSLFGYAR